MSDTRAALLVLRRFARLLPVLAFACGEYNYGQIGVEFPGDSQPAPAPPPPHVSTAAEAIGDLEHAGESLVMKSSGDLARFGPFTARLAADTCYRFVVFATGDGAFASARGEALHFVTDAADVVSSGQVILKDGMSVGFCSPDPHDAARIGLWTGSSDIAPQDLGEGAFELRLYTDGIHRRTGVEPTMTWDGRKLSLVSSVEGRCNHPPPIDFMMQGGRCYFAGVWMGQASAWTSDALERGFDVRLEDAARGSVDRRAGCELSNAVGALVCRDANDTPNSVSMRATLEMKPRKADTSDAGGDDPNPEDILGFGRCATFVYAD